MKNANRVAAIALIALALGAGGALAQAKEEPSLPEQIIEGVRGFFRGLFGGEGESPPAPAPVEERAPPQESAAQPVKGDAKAKESAEIVVKPTPAAQAAPASLHAVVAKGDFAAASQLIAQGADIEAKDPGTGASVLHYAVMRGNPETIDLLLARGADVNSRTRTGTTPLHTAVLYNRYEVAEKLLNKGADVNAESASGATPLALASAARNRTVAELLRSRGGR
jgi:hypothetical protein